MASALGKISQLVSRKMRRLEEHDFRHRLESYLGELRHAVMGCRTLLDIGCGPQSLMARIDWDYSVGIEGYGPAAETARLSATHSQVVSCNLLEIPLMFEPASFDAVAALDVIEHLEKEEGYRLIETMERLARKVVVLSTPNGFLPQSSDDNELQEHISGWDWREMEELGFTVRGLFGPKVLRGEYHLPRFRPAPLFGLLAEAGDLFYTRSHPRSAAGILCTKHTD